ncbi:anthranilate synthase component I family protein [Curtobacterium sp. RRHDQ10]|uniref:anthranilate synthase component I family protein n=1 Tax=Curtobacterium phyllosphaerae TaxID=3413379 RepID=UPI003BF05BB0
MRIEATRVDGMPDAAVLLDALAGASDDVLWLDSSAGAGAGAADPERSRWSVLAVPDGPFSAAFTHRDGVATTRAAPAATWFATGSRERPCFPALGDLLAAVPPMPEPVPGCGFALGWVGYLGYELGRESGGPDRRADGHPDADLRFVDRAVVLDGVDGVAWVLALVEDHEHGPDDRDDARGPTATNRAWAVATCSALRALVTVPTSAPSGADPTPALPSVSAATPIAAPGREQRAAYERAVEACREEIRHGNAFQVCLTTAFAVPVPVAGARRSGREARPGLAADPAFRTYRRLRDADPVPFGSFLRLGAVTVASRSPERFLSISAAGRVVAEPMKGTRGRGATPAQDDLLRAELAASAKDRAENVMIVDLLRNDLLRTAVPGSVHVERLCVVETFATVHQMVSTVVASVPTGTSRAAVVGAAFPPGSMTGAPKISAMGIIDRLERAPRGVYSGVVGYFSLSGAVDLAVAIRTLVTVRTRSGGSGDVVRRTLGAGGAVTWSSTAAAEADEVVTKTRSVLGSLGAVATW